MAPYALRLRGKSMNGVRRPRASRHDKRHEFKLQHRLLFFIKKFGIGFREWDDELEGEIISAVYERFPSLEDARNDTLNLLRKEIHKKKKRHSQRLGIGNGPMFQSSEGASDEQQPVPGPQDPPAIIDVISRRSIDADVPMLEADSAEDLGNTREETSHALVLYSGTLVQAIQQPTVRL
ncbi:hypothetical protein AAF712_010631 [Marasmius tenuissimus]|uniref:Uncharacterized protein n=1 Tax=Marasmius tenuissimus TaxID=585030 RepID=A0ABR2ZM79_9AGAR